MFIAYVVVAVVTIIATAAIAVADYARAGFVVANSAEVGVPAGWLPALATAKLAGALGLSAGLLGFRTLGIAAAIGLVLFFVGAVGAHIRTGVLHNIAFPTGFLTASATTLGLALAY